jgi:adenylate cyclase
MLSDNARYRISPFSSSAFSGIVPTVGLDDSDLHTFLFADLAGFTALTEAHGDERAADVVAAFCEAVEGLLERYRAEQVKTIGDAVMMRTMDAAAAVRLGLCVVNDIGGRHEFPVIRVGMHSGSAVERAGDWFGATVNVAARVSGAASGGEVLLTDATRELAENLDGVVLHARGVQTFKNVKSPVALYSASWRSKQDAAGLPIDPVCRMAVETGSGAGTLNHHGAEYHFCSLDCAGAFASEPDRYV